MNIRKINFIQAAGSLIALLMYLFLPIIRIVLLVGTGFSGETCMQVDDLFIIPVVLTGLALVVSFLPIGNISSFAGIAASLGQPVGQPAGRRRRYQPTAQRIVWQHAFADGRRIHDAAHGMGDDGCYCGHVYQFHCRTAGSF